MKKNLLFTGLLLAAVPAFAQQTEPTRHPESDPYQIFYQDFEFQTEGEATAEELFLQWQQQDIDTIHGVQYYIHQKESGDNLGTKAKPWEDREHWQRGPIRDTTIVLRNEVMVADNPTDSILFTKDEWGLINENRSEELAKYGITGGERYFQYYAADTTMEKGMSNSSAYSGNRAARYRRNLFVRGIAGQGNIPVQDTTSYRFTAYVTANYQGTTDKTPILYADVMRGHFASEKPFTMGIEDKKEEYKYNKQFVKDVEFKPADNKKAEYKLGEWSKVTFMTYYTNDSIADDYVFVDGYWWDAEWSWTDEEKTEGKEWNYIVQPDKFFVRIGFAQDSTIYGIDDISLTKSWIGGCEFNGDKLRVDFGYKTNLIDLCEQSYEKTNVSSVEIVGDYFDVWGMYEGVWEQVPIRSAEYQKDGYMYMFTDCSENFGGEYADFNVYDSVLVSFKNPRDQKDKMLCYDINSTFPRAWDVEWIKAGLPVMDFTNEVATPNPAVGENVWSMKDLPPVVKGGYTYESGSFQLDGTIRELDFVFSRRICYDDKGLASDYALLTVTNGSGKETWFVDNVNVLNADSAIVTFKRPEQYTEPLSGDYEFTFIQLCGAADPAQSDGSTTNKITDWGGEYTIEYSFGPQPVVDGLVAKVTFEKQKTSKARSKEITLDGFTMSNCYMAINEFAEGSLFNKGLTFGVDPSIGTGASSSKRATLNYAFNVSAQGDYDFSLLFVAHHGQAPKLGVTVYDADGNKVSNIDEYDLLPKKKAEDSVIVNVDTINFTLDAMAAGNYKMSLVLTNSEDGMYWPPYAMGNSDNVTLFSLGIIESGKELPAFLSIGYPYTSAFAAAKATLASAIAKAEVNADQYGGAAYVAGNSVKSKYADFNSGKDVTAPSAWTAATAEINGATKSLNDRIAIVAEMWKQYGILSDTLANLSDLDTDLEEMGSYKAADAVATAYADLKASEISDDSVKAVTKIFTDAIAEVIAQYSIIDSYRDVLKAADDSVKSSFAMVATDAYKLLSDTVEVANAFDEVAATSAQIAEVKASLVRNLYKYADVINPDQVNRLYIADLAALTSGLGYDLSASSDKIADLLAENNYDALESLYKNAIKSSVYGKIVNSEKVDSLPVSALIKNRQLYASAKAVDRAKTNSDQNRDLVDKDGANIRIVNHQYNNVPIWIMIIDHDYDDLFYGWTARSEAKGNTMATATAKEGDYSQFGPAISFFNGSLSMDWTSKANVKQTVEDLPVGLYSIGVNLIKNSGNDSQIEVTAANTKSNKFAANKTGNSGVDSVLVNDTATISLWLYSESNWSIADDFYMVFRGAAEADYEELKSAADQAVNTIVTFDDAADEAEAQYEYYTLDGIKTDAPEGIVIRVNIATGEVEKVLFK